MRILLVRSPRIKQSITIGEFMFCEPLGLEAVFSVLKENHTVKILDLMVDKTDIARECSSWKPEVVGITSLCVDVNNVLALAKKIKANNRNITIVVGGTHAFLDPAAFQDDSVDHVMEYTTRNNLEALFSHLAQRSEVPFIDGVRSRAHAYRSTGVSGRNEYIIPDLESTERYRKHYSYFGYKPCAIMQTSQGCSKHCSFCLRWHIEGPRERPQPMDIIFYQIQRIKEPSIMILDNDFLCDGSRLHEFCAQLEQHRLHKNFICYGSVHSVLKNREAVSRFARNGLAALLVGYETFRSSELDSYDKRTTPEDNMAAATLLKGIKVDVWASFIMHPDWDAHDFLQFRRYVRMLNPEITSMTALTPFPTLPLHEEYRDRLLYQKEDYEMWSLGVVTIRPARMSLRQYYLELLKTTLYINWISNSTAYLIRKFGIGALFRVLTGSTRLMYRYLMLMTQAGTVTESAHTMPHQRK